MLNQERELKKVVPAVEFEGTEGRSSCFEVTVDDKFVAYSKLASGKFPDFAAVAKEIAEFGASGKAPAHWTAK